MKIIIIISIVFLSFAEGMIAVFLGLKKKSKDQKAFLFTQFIQKGFRRTKLNDFTGGEIIAMGIVGLFLSFLTLFVFKDLLISYFIKN